MARFVRPVYNTDVVFASACAAHRVNDGYFKEDQIKIDDDGEITITKLANKKLIHQFLRGEVEVTEQDREFAIKVLQYCNGLSFKIITGAKLNDFERNMLRISDEEVINNNYDIAVISSLPASYERAQVRIQQDIVLREKSGILTNKIDDKVELDIEVIRCNYSNNWNTYYITGLVENAVVFFANRNKVEVGSKHRIKGKVKAHKEDRTQLSHVKFI